MGSIFRLWRLPLLVAVCALAALSTGAGTAKAHFCHETVNPAANPAVGDNGFPDDPFGGDAVPGGTTTTPGTTTNGPINPDGFYLVNGLIFSDDTPIAYPGGGFFWPTTAIKYTEWGNNNIRVTSNIGGPNSAILYHIQAPGDLYVERPKSNDGIFCGVPPPPF
jgi:hypothetical protein